MVGKLDSEIEIIQKEFSDHLYKKTGTKKLSGSFKKLQTDILFLHDYLDVMVTMYIIVEIIKGTGMKIKKITLLPTMSRLNLILQKIRFIDKIAVIQKMGGWPKEAIQLMYWENKIRNEFAHTPADLLSKKYEVGEDGKKRKLTLIKKLYEALYKANYMLENHDAP